MKKLKIYKKNNEYILERINEFNHSFKKQYITENGLFEAVEPYKFVIDKYKLEVEEGIDILPKVYQILFA